MAKLPYTLLVPPTPEDEAFDEVERAQQWKVEDIVRREAQIAAMQFIDENDVIELGIMTLRKAFETGYRAGMYAEKRTKKQIKDNHETHNQSK